jgi:hypothetical protein
MRQMGESKKENGEPYLPNFVESQPRVTCRLFLVDETASTELHIQGNNTLGFGCKLPDEQQALAGLVLSVDSQDVVVSLVSLPDGVPCILAGPGDCWNYM